MKLWKALVEMCDYFDYLMVYSYLGREGRKQYLDRIKDESNGT